MKNVLSLVCLLIFASTIFAQEIEPTKQVPAESNPATILLLLNESQPNQVIVYDSKGEWLSSIREIKLTIDLLGTGIQAECTSWKGVLRPSSPKKYTTQVKEIKSITSDDFASRLADLNE
jgi:hypothetical protein